MLGPLRQLVLDAVPRVIRRGPGSARRVAITFDDGPLANTGAYLDTLDQVGAPATFFIMGDMAVEQPAMTREYVRRGHQIASHGWNHRAFPTLTAGELRRQLIDTEAAIGVQPAGRWIRPPYGALSTSVAARLLARGYTIALWSFESKDHEITDVDELCARCAPENVAPGEVLLFHEGYAHTLAALPRIVGALRDAGYECVTMHDLLAH